MLLHLSTWQEVEAYLQRSPAVIIPIGSTEQHGPTGLIGTDFICAEAIARAVGENADALVTSTLTLGMAEHHTGFAGTISLKPSTLTLVIHDVVRSLAKHGFKRFFFLNGHGGNIAVLKTAFTEIYNELPDVRCRLGNWWASGEIYKLVKELYGNQEGYHATPSEIAVTMYLYPDAIKKATLSDSVNKDSRIYSPEEFRKRYPDGRMGSNPALATVEHGQQLFELSVKELVSQYNDFIAEI
ncbi:MULTISPECIES: creatininase family protein [Pseudanabaena]|jgi:creatinine amidohydrolase|uniref:creatininase family protein n=1 Tax=Pseudanabaena TaxID=1152 RepID=UPI00247A8F4D|nr:MULTISPECIES: creatininase family protein [Pseudanabaena]MEA5485753.1 creatininase family protein [Pseudanabaena sp. CCNP1317]WGS72098.1 creatininase family protein [Pseudanabaena galeata CCNP1313]